LLKLLPKLPLRLILEETVAEKNLLLLRTVTEDENAEEIDGATTAEG